MTDDALDPELPDDERETLQTVVHLLRRDRPVPRAAFRGDLGRRLAAQPPRAARPRMSSRSAMVRDPTHCGLNPPPAPGAAKPCCSALPTVTSASGAASRSTSPPRHDPDPRHEEGLITR